jgi:hypothetical protein
MQTAERTLHLLTDIHYPVDGGRLERYARALADGALERPARVIFGGDLVDGHPGDEAGLRAQLREFRLVADGLGVPWHAVCHTHDRFGDPPDAFGRSFMEVLEQPLMNHVSMGSGLDLYLLSGSINCCSLYHPPGGLADPEGGQFFDIFNEHVWEAFARFVSESPGGGVRVLITHQPIVPFLDLIDAGHPDVAHIRPYYFLGEEGQALCLKWLETLKIRHVFSGHCHLETRNFRNGIEFVTVPSFKNRRTGFGVLSWDGWTLRHRVQPW